MISVVTAYYNRKKLFIRTLESMKPHFGKIDFEVIVVDDGSDEAERLEDLQADFPFLRIIRLEKENKWYKNPCIPFNIGFAEIKGDKVIIQNPECFHFDNILEYVDKNLQENNYLSFGCFSLDKQNTNSDALLSNKEHVEKLILENNRTFVKNGDLGWYNHSKFRPEAYHFCAAMTKKDLYDLGGFDERYANGVGYDDDDFIWRIKVKKMVIKFIDDHVVLHQNHYNYSENKVETEEIIKQIKETYKRNKKIFEEITVNSNLYKVNYLGDIDAENPLVKIEENYFFEFNKVIKELVGNRFKRKIGLQILKIISKL
jgi:glycosyltransferase involved in cell wall biosynthesis